MRKLNIENQLVVKDLIRSNIAITSDDAMKVSKRFRSLQKKYPDIAISFEGIAMASASFVENLLSLLEDNFNTKEEISIIGISDILKHDIIYVFASRKTSHIKYHIGD